jgi:hypothetical protein
MSTRKAEAERAREFVDSELIFNVTSTVNLLTRYLHHFATGARS